MKKITVVCDWCLLSRETRVVDVNAKALDICKQCYASHLAQVENRGVSYQAESACFPMENLN